MNKKINSNLFFYFYTYLNQLEQDALAHNLYDGIVKLSKLLSDSTFEDALKDTFRSNYTDGQLEAGHLFISNLINQILKPSKISNSKNKMCDMKVIGTVTYFQIINLILIFFFSFFFCISHLLINSNLHLLNLLLMIMMKLKRFPKLLR